MALVGDSLHAFPPDLGQGVNSGLKDVLMLGKHLSKAKPALAQQRGSLQAGLKGYEDEATAEARALVRLMQLGGP